MDWLKICQALVMRYVLLELTQFFALRLFILVFEISAIIHQQVVATLQGFMKFVYKQARGDMVSNTVKSSNRIMELCPEQKPDNFSHPHYSEAECPSRSQVKNFQRSHRMDAQSKHFQGSGRVVARLVRPDIDLFASRVNHQIPEFVSWRPEPNAVVTDAFNLTWNYPLGYLFPPFSLIPLCLKKIQRDQAEFILIAPVWKSRPWYPILLSMLPHQLLWLPQS